MLEIAETPFVSSIIPEKMLGIKLSGMLNKLNKGENRTDKALKIPVFLRMDIITLNNITKPPIITIVDTDDIILFCKIPPNEFSLGGIFF